MAEALERFPADIVHFHNVFPILGVGAIAEAANRGCATVQTLHNYRLSCIRGTHELGGRTCTRCRVGRHLQGVLRGCYRGSRAQSVLMANAQSALWRNMIAYGVPHVSICLTHFAAAEFEAYDLATRVMVKPNSVSFGEPQPYTRRSGALYVGRLSHEKGIAELVSRWPRDAVQLTVIGDGPLFGSLSRSSGPNVQVIGSATSSEVRMAMRSARCLVFPSLCLEGLPMTILEALSEGTPIAGYGVGGAGVIHHFGSAAVAPFGHADELASAANGLSLLPDGKWTSLSDLAVTLHRRSFTHQANLDRLLSIYEYAQQAVRQDNS
jgi:glycosyltransferase involved in cell wall biosynthesis